MSPGYDEPGYEKKKQDCERKAFYRLADKLKKAFPRLPVCISADSLYNCKPVYEKCRENNWRFILRFKEGSIPSLYNNYRKISAEPGHSFNVLRKSDSQNDSLVNLEYTYANGLQYEGFSLNMAECKDSRVEYPFLFVTDLSVNRKNCESTVMDGRRRWRIENEGFKVQKKHGYYLKHVFCKDYNAMKVHYLAIQIAHTINQLLKHSSTLIKKLNLSNKEFYKSLKKSFNTFVLTSEDFAAVEKPRKFRLSA
jgi:hypothetical protein